MSPPFPHPLDLHPFGSLHPTWSWTVCLHWVLLLLGGGVHDLEKEGTWNPAWLGSHLLGGLTFHTRKMGLFLEHTLLFHCLPGLLLPQRLAHSRPQAFEQEAWDRIALLLQSSLHQTTEPRVINRARGAHVSHPEVIMVVSVRKSGRSFIPRPKPTEALGTLRAEPVPSLQPRSLRGRPHGASCIGPPGPPAGSRAHRKRLPSHFPRAKLWSGLWPGQPGPAASCLLILLHHGHGGGERLPETLQAAPPRLQGHTGDTQ